MLALPGAVRAASFVQVASATPQSPSASVSVTFKHAQTAGDLNVVVVGWNDTVSAVTSVADSAGNLYHLAIGPTVGSGLSQSIYYAPDITSGSNTVTVTFNQPAAYPDIRVLEYQGYSSLDVSRAATGNSASTSSGTATTSGANELIFAANTVATGVLQAGSGFTTRVITSPDMDMAEDETATTAGSNSATATLYQAGAWVMQMAAFSTASMAQESPAQVSLGALSCNNSSATGAASDACTVTLTTGAGSGGLTVALSSNDSSVSVPSSVTVAAGAASASFIASVAAVSSTQTATLTASAGGASKTFAVQLNATSAAVALESTSVAFGNVNVNSKATQSVVLTSSGTAALTVNSASVTGTGFSGPGMSLPVTLNPNQTATLELQFAPTSAGSASGTVTISSNASNAPTATISLSGTGVSGSYEVELAWNAPGDPADPAAGYNVYRALSGSSTYQLVTSSLDGDTSFTDTSVQNGTNYQYRVESVDANGVASAPSASVAVSIP